MPQADDQAIVDDAAKTNDDAGGGDDAANAAAEQARLDALVDDTLDLPKPPAPKDDKAGDDDAGTGDDDKGDDDGADDDAGAGDADDDSGDDSDDDSAGADDDSDDDAAAKDAKKADQGPSDAEIFIEVEDINGAKFKITKIEDLPEDFEPKNNRQIMEIIAQVNKLEGDLAKKAEDDAAAEQQAILDAARDERLRGWEGEIDALTREGVLTKPKLTADNPKYADDPAVKKTDAVFKFIMETNAERKKAGNPNFLTSFRDALELIDFRDMKAKAAEDKKTETDTAKTKAGVIGGNSTTRKDEPVYRAGSYRSIDDVPV